MTRLVKLAIEIYFNHKATISTEKYTKKYAKNGTHKCVFCLFCFFLQKKKEKEKTEHVDMRRYFVFHVKTQAK